VAVIKLEAERLTMYPGNLTLELEHVGSEFQLAVNAIGLG
jgi:hypothetical protein